MVFKDQRGAEREDKATRPFWERQAGSSLVLLVGAELLIS